MEVVLSQILNLLPLFAIIWLGYLFGSILKVKSYEILSKIILFIFWPIVAFNALSTMTFSWKLLILPIVFFFTTTLLTLSSRWFLERNSDWDKKLTSTFSYSSGSGNVIFVGLPAVGIILGEQFVPFLLISVVGYIIFDSSIGYLVMSGEKFDPKKIFIKLIKFPPIIGVLLGLLFLILGINLSGNDAYRFIVDNSQTTMATLGLFLVGLAVSNISSKIDFGYLWKISIVKVLINPVLILAVLFLDKMLFNYFAGLESVMLLIASVPVASNTVVLATSYTGREQIAALGVLVTAVLSLISIPIWQMIGSLYF